MEETFNDLGDRYCYRALTYLVDNKVYRLGVVSDVGLVPDPQGIIEAFQVEMAESLAAG